jgi:asparagine synthase (glutamine-hydrolysing)
MCGICGIVGTDSRDAGEAAVRRMTNAMLHRGPDGEGLLSAGPVVAGMRRLSIVDLSSGGQPIWNETGTRAVVFNGEIYNFQDLRTQLEVAGHKFRTRSDTEVIVHSYEEWGTKCVERLQGMFAFAIVELPGGSEGLASRIFIARDPLGIKPLYYALADGKFIFASEVRALLASGVVSAQLCEQTVRAYLLFGSVCEPLTLIEGVKSLPPGHAISLATALPIHSVTPVAYWAPPPTRVSNGSNPRETRSSPARHIRDLLEKSVASHLVADVPVGVFLSSGLDSTAIAALATATQGGIHTFTVAFPDIEFSEAEKARQTAARLATDHSELTLSGSEMVARLDEAVAAFDQPSMDGVNTYFVSWAARQAGLKVALSGLGSDELFGGYQSFRATAMAKRAASAGSLFPAALRPLISNALKAGSTRSSADRMRKLAAAFADSDSLPHEYLFTRLLFTPEAIAPNGAARSGPDTTQQWWLWFAQAAEQARRMDAFTGISWVELRSYLLNTLLRDTDAMSMRNSLEVRVPFLHSPLVEYVLSLPESAKHNGTHPKSLLVAALGDLLPTDLVMQRKRTFTFPWERWLRGALSDRVAAGLNDWSPALEPMIGADFARNVWEDFQRRLTSWSRPWSLYVLNEWVKINLRETGAGFDVAARPVIAAVSQAPIN